MSVLAIIGFILAVLNPVVGGVLVGYFVWLDDATTGFQIIVLSFFMLGLYGIGFVVWTQKKIQRLERALGLYREKEAKIVSGKSP